MKKQLQQEIIEREPLLKGIGSRILSLSAFTKRCHVLRAPTTQRIGIGPNKDVEWRKYVLYFGLDSNSGRWKYWARVYAPTKKRAVERFYECVRLSALGEPLPIPEGDLFLEGFIAGYDGKVAIAF